jgi:1-acyl-sn-glycerol-3-phosphate acyltransferase
MKLMRWFVTGVAKRGLEIMCRIDKSELDKVQARGPLIAYSNHTGSIEVPLMFTQLQPRPVTGLAKIESWDGWFLRWIFNLWGAIPLRRGEADMTAMRKALEALKAGYIIGMSPEGTRNKTGALIEAHPGIVSLALHSNAPLIPIAHWGGENFSANLKHLKRTDFHIRVGEPFYLDSQGEKLTRQVRQQMLDELMYRLAVLLPEEYHGVYANLEKATSMYLRKAD